MQYLSAKRILLCGIALLFFADITYDFLALSPQEIEPILSQEWHNGFPGNDVSLSLEEKHFGRRGTQLVIGKRYSLDITYISAKQISPTAIIERFQQQGYALQEQYGNPAQEAVYILKKKEGRFQNNVSCTIYIRNYYSLQLIYQYTT